MRRSRRPPAAEALDRRLDVTNREVKHVSITADTALELAARGDKKLAVDPATFGTTPEVLAALGIADAKTVPVAYGLLSVVKLLQPNGWPDMTKYALKQALQRYDNTRDAPAEEDLIVGLYELRVKKKGKQRTTYRYPSGPVHTLLYQIRAKPDAGDHGDTIAV